MVICGCGKGDVVCEGLCNLCLNDETNRKSDKPKRVRKPLPPKPCEICKKEFLPKSANAKCCGKQCSKALRDQQMMNHPWRHQKVGL